MDFHHRIAYILHGAPPIQHAGVFMFKSRRSLHAIFLGLMILLLSPVPSQAMFHLVTGENHPELRWRTLRTAHFRVHYHQGLEEMARQTADVAEQVYGPVTRQMGVEPRHRTELAITDADAVVNGFAMKQRINIWVNQNDYIRAFTQDQEWLQQVIAHEFQHVVAFEAMRDWRGSVGLALSGTPAWWYEGLAEYYTERWNTLRSDRTLRRETLDGRLKESEAHDAGYAKVLYLAWRSGDSTLVKISRWRHKQLRIHTFDDAFKEVTGQSVKAFDAEWARVMNGLYNAELVCGEDLPDIGRRVHLPINRVSWLALLPDSSAWLAVGRDSLADLSVGLFHIACDSTRRQRTLVDGNLRGRAALAHDGSRVVFDRTMHGRHGALGMDLWSYDLQERQLKRLTCDNRSQDPALSSSGQLAWLSTLGARHRLMIQAPGEEARILWDPGPLWEMMRPSFSPDGRQLALATDDPQSRKRLTLVDCASGAVRHLDSGAPDERDPVWLEDSLIVTTAFVGQRANLLARDPQGGARPLSDSGEGLWSIGAWQGTDGAKVVALALDSAQFSRPMLVDAHREVRPLILNAHPRYTAWRDMQPALRVPKWNREEHAEVLDDHAYRPWEFTSLGALALPLPDGVMGVAVLADPLAHHLVSVVGGAISRKAFGELQWDFHRFAWDLSLSGGYQSRYSLTVVNDELVETTGSALSLSAGRRWHFNSRPHSRLLATLAMDLQDQQRTGSFADADSLFQPRDNRSGALRFGAAWRESPAVRDGDWWPRNGAALRLHARMARPWIHGEEEADFWGAGAWWMHRLRPASMVVFSARMDGISGRKRTSRALGFSPDAVIGTLPVSSLTQNPSDASFGPLSRLRALNRSVAGDRVTQGTMEVRQALGKLDLLRVLTLRTARINLASFVDLGQVADRGRFTSTAAEWLWTTGVEAQVELSLGPGFSLGLALGSGGEGVDWLRKGQAHRRTNYWGLHLTRPF